MATWKYKTITQEQKREFWKHNINPITGFPDARVYGVSLGPAALKIPKVQKTRYTN